MASLHWACAPIISPVTSHVLLLFVQSNSSYHALITHYHHRHRGWKICFLPSLSEILSDIVWPSHVNYRILSRAPPVCSAFPLFGPCLDFKFSVTLRNHIQSGAHPVFFLNLTLIWSFSAAHIIEKIQYCYYCQHCSSMFNLTIKTWAWVVRSILKQSSKLNKNYTGHSVQWPANFYWPEQESTGPKLLALKFLLNSDENHILVHVYRIRSNSRACSNSRAPSILMLFWCLATLF